MRQRPSSSRRQRISLAAALAAGAATLLAGSAPPGGPVSPAAAADDQHALEAGPGRERAIRCILPPRVAGLPAGAIRGLAHHLRQYPSVALATGAERRAARDLLARLRSASSRWRDARDAADDGFATRTAPRRVGDRAAHYLHAEHRRFSHDGRFLDPDMPESLIYANAPGRALVLVGVMFSVPRGVEGPAPGGPLTRWHSHLVCARGDRRGLKPRADGNCPPGASLRQGSEMLHVWFTRELRSSYAIHAPQPELCGLGLLSAEVCAGSIGLEM
jgi:hypothetical protein